MDMNEIIKVLAAIKQYCARHHIRCPDCPFYQRGKCTLPVVWDIEDLEG